MRIDEPGWITDGILLLGSRHACSYLIRGERYALLGGNVAWEVPRLAAQLDRRAIDPRRITHLVISHAHHDHCGAVPYLLKRYPHIQTVASEYGAYVLGREKAVALMRRVNRQTIDGLGRDHVFEGIGLDFEAIPISRTVKTGDRLDLGGGVTLQFFETPGHSRCSLSVYIPREETLFPADALPYPGPDGNNLVVTANHDYDDYIRSLKRLASLPISRVGYEHGGVLAGDDARDIIARSLAATREQRQRIVHRYEQIGDLDRLIKEIAGKYLKLELFKRVPVETMRAIIERMVRSALRMV
jgi:glyoxylase-like metal-dependent hydrolase (beta-lactamase superfamily II)